MIGNRLIRGLLSGRAFSFLPLVPRAARLFENWIGVLRSYAGIGSPPHRIRMRGGAGLETQDQVDVATVIVVWVRRDYGEPPTSGVVIDIGANIGAFTVLAGLRGSRVFAFEPMPTTFSQLQRNVASNGLADRVTLEPLGVTAVAATRRLYLSSGSAYHSIHEARPGTRYIEMETTTLDRIFRDHRLERCDLLKMDCEGAEFEIFYGTSPDTLARIGEIRMEYHDRKSPSDHNVTELERYLSRHGFRRVKKDETTLMLWLSRSDDVATA